MRLSCMICVGELVSSACRGYDYVVRDRINISKQLLLYYCMMMDEICKQLLCKNLNSNIVHKYGLWLMTA